MQNQVYQEIKPNVLALAQTLGSPTTAAILPDMKSSNVVGAPAAWVLSTVSLTLIAAVLTFFAIRRLRTPAETER